MPYPKYPLLSKNSKSGKSLLKNDNAIKINKDDLFTPFSKGMGLKSLIGTFPKKSENLSPIRDITEKIIFSRKTGKPFILNLNSEVIDKNMVPLIIDLMERGWISAISSDLAFAVSDFEISLSEKFVNYKQSFLKSHYDSGIAEETGIFFNIAIKESFGKNMGLGEALGSYIESSRFEFFNHSVIYSAYKLNIPVTFFSTFGSHPIYFQSGFDIKILNDLLERDFIIFSSIISKMDGGGIIVSLEPDLATINVILNSLAFNNMNNDRFGNYYISIIKSKFSEEISSIIKLLSEKTDLTLYHIKSEIDIVFPLISALIKQ